MCWFRGVSSDVVVATREYDMVIDGDYIYLVGFTPSYDAGERMPDNSNTRQRIRGEQMGWCKLA